MKVLLLQHVPKTGRKYEIKDVANGFALNHLFPQKKAVPATDSNIKKYDTLRSRHEDEKNLQIELLEKNIESLNGRVIAVSAKANEQGHLFAGIHDIAVVDEIEKETGMKIPLECLILEGNIKTLGEHDIEIKAGKAKATLKFVVEEE